MPGLTFASDTDITSSYYEKDLDELNERMPDNRKFTRHPVMSHQSNGLNTLVVSHGANNRSRSAREIRPDDEAYKWEEEGEECFISQERFYRDRIIKDGHTPQIYTNITGEYFDGKFVTFQSNPAAKLIRDSIEQAVDAGTTAELHSPRNSIELSKNLTREFLTEKSKNWAEEILNSTNKAYTAMTER